MEATDLLALLSTALSGLEAALGPLLATPLLELTADALPLEKAKLDVTMAYVVHDLIWIYLKTVGVDPATHPVMEELGRVKGYFDKLKSAETKDTPKFKIDKAAANRFISAAIASGSSAGKAMNSQPATHVRFDEADKLLMDTVEDEDEIEVEVVAEEKEIEAPQGTGKKSLSRPKMDPFTGYDAAPATKSKKSKRDDKRKRASEVEPTAPEVVSSKSPGKAKKAKKTAGKTA